MISNPEIYTICAPFNDVDSSVELTAEEFKLFRHATEVLSACLDFEEKYALLLGNYISFEKTVVGFSVEEMTQFKWFADGSHYGDNFLERLTVCREVINFLTSSKMYVDQVKKDIRKCLGSEEEAADLVSKYTSQQYESLFEYRFITALRNHTQHYSQPISEINYLSSSERKEDGKFFWNYSSRVSISKKLLSQNSKFPKKVLAEIEEKVDVGEAMRVYMASMSYIHSTLRDHIQGAVDEARATLVGACQRISPDLRSTDAAFIQCFENKEAESKKKPREKHLVLLAHDDIRIRLQQKNLDISNLARRGVTNSHRRPPSNPIKKILF